MRAPAIHGAILALLLALPLTVGEFGLTLGAKLAAMALFAMSLDLLVGTVGLVSLGHAAYLGLAAYAAALLPPGFASLPAAVAAAGLAALVIGALCLRASGVYFIMATLAFAQMAFTFVQGASVLGGSDGLLIDARPLLVKDAAAFYLFSVAVLAAGYGLLAWVVRSPFGRKLAGIRMNEARMASLGYATYRLKLAAFVIAGAVAGLAGWLMAYQAEYVSPGLLDWRLSGLALMMVILGGKGTLYGPAIGAAALVLLEEVLSDLTAHWMLGMGLFVILAVILLPRGLAGLRRHHG
ncbi:MAG: branched-chain amino acid ABC transporter permease [Magnetospirillum sp. WYHS-4]